MYENYIELIVFLLIGIVVMVILAMKIHKNWEILHNRRKKLLYNEFDKEFKPFLLEFDELSYFVDSRERWIEVMEACLIKNINPYYAKSRMSIDCFFGFKKDHNGEFLFEFFDKNNMIKFGIGWWE